MNEIIEIKDENVLSPIHIYDEPNLGEAKNIFEHDENMMKVEFDNIDSMFLEKLKNSNSTEELNTLASEYSDEMARGKEAIRAKMNEYIEKDTIEKTKTAASIPIVYEILGEKNQRVDNMNNYIEAEAENRINMDSNYKDEYLIAENPELTEENAGPSLRDLIN